MGWNYPEISLEDMVKLVKGFIDIIILASGYQSSGSQAHWDCQNIKKALQWGSFFENVMRCLNKSVVYQDSLKELDSVLSEVKSVPHFPQGLSHLSSATLSSARNFVLMHLFGNLSLRDSHLQDLILATIELDIDQISEKEEDYLYVYLDKLRLQDASVDSVSHVLGFSKDLVPNFEMESDNNLTKFAIREVLKRQSAVLCISMIENGLAIVAETMRHTWTEYNEEQLPPHRGTPAVVGTDQLVDFASWEVSKSKNLSFFLDERSVRLVSGASLMFSAPKVQWVQVLRRLNTSTNDNLLETMELLLFGCVYDRWSGLIEYLMSISYESCTVLKMFSEVCKFHSRKSQNFHALQETSNSKEISILDYLAELLGGQFHKLLKLFPALIAAALPIWLSFDSPLSLIKEFISFPLKYIAVLKGETHTLSDTNTVYGVLYWLYTYSVADAVAVLTISRVIKTVSWPKEYGASMSSVCVVRRKNTLALAMLIIDVDYIRDFDVVPQECVDYISHYMKLIQYVADSERANIDKAREYLSGCCNLRIVVVACQFLIACFDLPSFGFPAKWFLEFRNVRNDYCPNDRREDTISSSCRESRR